MRNYENYDEVKYLFLWFVGKARCCENFTRDDVMSVCHYSYVEACHGFDETRGTKFYSYLAATIKNNLTVERTQYFSQTLSAPTKVKLDALSLTNGREVSGENRIARATKYLANEVVSGSDVYGDSLVVMDTIGSDEPPVTDSLAIDEVKKVVRESLDGMRAKIIQLILLDNTQAEVARIVGLSRERVRQLYEDAVKEIRHVLQVKTARRRPEKRMFDPDGIKRGIYAFAS